jgi:hypothetical protein
VLELALTVTGPDRLIGTVSVALEVENWKSLVKVTPPMVYISVASLDVPGKPSYWKTMLVQLMVIDGL